MDNVPVSISAQEIDRNNDVEFNPIPELPKLLIDKYFKDNSIIAYSNDYITSSKENLKLHANGTTIGPLHSSS